MRYNFFYNITFMNEMCYMLYMKHVENVSHLSPSIPRSVSKVDFYQFLLTIMSTASSIQKTSSHIYKNQIIYNELTDRDTYFCLTKSHHLSTAKKKYKLIFCAWLILLWTDNFDNRSLLSIVLRIIKCRLNRHGKQNSVSK